MGMRKIRPLSSIVAQEPNERGGKMSANARAIRNTLGIAAVSLTALASVSFIGSAAFPIKAEE
jgi:hypothetical protein